MQATVRDLVASDRAEWERMFRAYLQFYKATVDEGVFDITFGRLISDEPNTHRGFIACLGGEDGQPVGLTHALYHRSTWVESGHVYLQDLFVDPNVRGGGIGKALIERVYGYADELGAARTYWLTHETNAPAIRLYDHVATRSGFIQYRK